jgi:hypothetical protein
MLNTLRAWLDQRELSVTPPKGFEPNTCNYSNHPAAGMSPTYSNSPPWPTKTIAFEQYPIRSDHNMHCHHPVARNFKTPSPLHRAETKLIIALGIAGAI